MDRHILSAFAYSSAGFLREPIRYRLRLALRPAAGRCTIVGSIIF
jgi:hypothetical protein